MRKGQQTKSEIIGQAFAYASAQGLDGLTIGSLAREVGMSKSGLFAHFRSKENLQLAVLEHASAIFIENVFVPALKVERGESRIRALFEGWQQWHDRADVHGCIFIAASSEFDDQPGAVHDFVQKTQRELVASLARFAQGAVEQGDFDADRDPTQFAFDFLSILLGYHHYHRLLEDGEAGQRLKSGFEDLVGRYKRTVV